MNDPEIEISDTTRLVKKTDCDAKITEIEGKTLNVTGLATTSSPNAVKNKTPNVSDLTKKKYYYSTILDIVYCILL